MVEVKAKAPKVDRGAAVWVELGEDVHDAIERFGGDVVFSNYLANAKIGVQSGIRRYLEAGTPPEEIQAKFDSYKPGVALDRVADPIAALAAKFSKMSAEEQANAFEMLKKKLNVT